MTDDQADLFSNGKSVEKARIEAAKEILIKAGYRIIDPVVVNDKIKNKRQLRDYFYMRLDAKHPNRQRHRVPNIKYDMQIIGRFVDSQMDGINKQAAIQECIAIIDALFDYEDEFNFKYPITDVGILGQGKLSWITEKVVEFLNRKRYESCELIANEKAEKIENSYEIDAKEVSDHLDDLLKKMEVNDG